MASFEDLRFRINLYKLKENRQISPKSFTNLVSSMLYEKRSVRSNRR
jgi:20S proteasome subunit beta 3